MVLLRRWVDERRRTDLDKGKLTKGSSTDAEYPSPSLVPRAAVTLFELGKDALTLFGLFWCLRTQPSFLRRVPTFLSRPRIGRREGVLLMDR